MVGPLLFFFWSKERSARDATVLLFAAFFAEQMICASGISAASDAFPGRGECLFIPTLLAQEKFHTTSVPNNCFNYNNFQ